jgi:hypothetical protein
VVLLISLPAAQDPNEVLNAISQEGWELVNANFVYEAFSSIGLTSAITGETVGYFHFTRAPQAATRQVPRRPGHLRGQAVST